MSESMLASLLLAPIVTEKAYRNDNTVVMKVRMDANKRQIRKAIEQLFDVNVLSVNTLVMKGKERRSGRLQKKGYTKNWKKAYVKLAEGQEINLFDTE